MENFTDEQFSDGAIDVLQKAGIRMCVDAPHSKTFKIDRCFPEPWMAMLTVQILVDLKKGGGMAELTQEQVERAVKAFNLCPSDQGGMGMIMNVGERLRSAAPFLQLPWSELISYTEDERFKEVCSAEGTVPALADFVRRRNASLLPKPVDPRIGVAIQELQGYLIHWGDDLRPIAENIISALDEVK